MVEYLLRPLPSISKFSPMPLMYLVMQMYWPKSGRHTPGMTTEQTRVEPKQNLDYISPAVGEITLVCAVGAFPLLHLHLIKHTSLKGSILMSFNKSVHPRDHHYGQGIEYFPSCQKVHLYFNSVNLICCHQRFIFSRVSYEWNYTICTLTCLASFSIMFLRFNYVARCIISFYC